jgi:hypothetical protein
MGRQQRRKREARAEASAKGFSPERGRDYFVVALFVLPIMVGLSALDGSPISFPGAVAFVLTFSVVAGVVGTFTDNVGF